MTEMLRYKIKIAATPERVWETLTTSEGTKATLYGSVIESSFEPGALLEFVGYDDAGERIVQVYGNVEVFEPPHRFSYIQHPGPIHNVKHAETTCRMTYRVTATDDGSELELAIDQWSDGNPAYEHAKASYPESAYLDGLRAYAESL